MDLERLYLDYNATSPLSASVHTWLKSGEVLFANPASQHTSGKSSRKLINQSRSKIYQTFGKNEKDTRLFFHSGATEAFTSFTYSFSEAARLAGKNLLVCYSKLDHPAVTSLSERYWGPQVKFLELKLKDDMTYDHGANLELIQDKKDNDPDLMVLYHHLWVHNETGLVSPLEELAKFKSIPDLYLHIDAVQAPGKIQQWRQLDVGDVWSFSAHKFGALKGIGFSLLRKELPFYPLITGGGQQQSLRSGTENVQGIRSVALALSDLEKVQVEQTTQLKDELARFIEQNLTGIGGVVSGPWQNSNTIYFYLNHLSSDIALALFDLNGLEISAGSACSSGAAKASLVLLHCGKKGEAKNGLRLSLPFKLDRPFLELTQSRLSMVFSRLKGMAGK